MFKKTDVEYLETLAAEILSAYHNHRYTGISMDITAVGDGWRLNVELSIGEKRLELQRKSTPNKEHKTIWIKPEWNTIYLEDVDFEILEGEK